MQLELLGFHDGIESLQWSSQHVPGSVCDILHLACKNIEIMSGRMPAEVAFATARLSFEDEGARTFAMRDFGG